MTDVTVDLVKQVIVIRKDLKMRRGKEIAQGAHASMIFLISRLRRSGHLLSSGITLTPEEWTWLERGIRKVTVQVDSEEELLAIHEAALDADLTSHLVTDSGFTEFKGKPTKTCLAIGPDLSSRIDPITGHLKLY